MSTDSPGTPGKGGAIMIGPTKAGKTTLLGCLELASRVTFIPPLGHVGIFAGNDPTAQLFDNARMIGAKGHINLGATNKAEQYHIDLRYKLPGGCLFLGAFAQEKTYHFRVIDGRGGDLIAGRVPDQETDTNSSRPSGSAQRGDVETKEDSRRTLIQLASNAPGLIVCLDANDQRSTGAFFQSMNRFLREVAQARNGQVPFERVAIVLAKADSLVDEEREKALAALCRKDPVTYTRHLLGEFALADLFTYLTPQARSQVFCGWASVYGFIQEDGAVNFQKGKEGKGQLAEYRENDGTWINRWRPFRVLDPFVFVATGHPVNMKQLTHPGTYQG